ncbi:hypothetical protein L3Q65_21070 [Amycolatopsis sp. FU40]|uniref:hypothetical protein n=1 Tax=Amycolatopsis sp. FU40 TaxID=2914159 RepID=UPI001F22F904|nr:hypothetical protein [Amycolatopsis sp. FU40]UKD59109.1 hypothetical protein L3Q65_21070 [Amycolatopsis sp. FU40]
MKSVIGWSIGLLLGLGLIAIGAFYTPSGPVRVLCGIEDMSPGTYCETTTYGQKSRQSYEEKLREATDTRNSLTPGSRWVTIGIGAVFAIPCGWRLVIAIRRKAKGGSGPAAQALPDQQPHPGFPPTPEYPQQPGFPPQQQVWQQPGFPPQHGFQQQPGHQPPQAGYRPPQPGHQQPQQPPHQ